MLNRLFMMRCLCILNIPSPKAKSGPDGKVSAVTGSQKSGSKPRDKGKTKKGGHLMMGSPGNCWQRIEPWGCSRYLGTPNFKNAASKVGGGLLAGNSVWLLRLIGGVVDGGLSETLKWGFGPKSCLCELTFVRSAARRS